MRAALATAAALATVLALGHAARADKDHHDDDAAAAGSGADQVVVVNAAPKLGDIGQIARVRRVLAARGLLFKLPVQLEATLDGRNVLIADLDAIRDAYNNTDYATALTLIEADENRILEQAVNRDPIPALAELSQWRGIIAAALNEEDEAVRQFRAAYRFNPAWTIDHRLASPRVRAMVKTARREPSEHGILRVEADPDNAKLAIDGGDLRDANQRIELPVGLHLVTISAPGRAPYAELVDIETEQPYRLQIALDKETKLDKAAKLVDETAAAPAGKPRLKRAKALARLTGVNRMLVVEDGSEGHLTMRLYDVELKKVSKPLELDGDATSAAIARKVAAALDPENLVDVSTIIVREAPAKTHWYEHWYVWAGVAAIGLSAYGGYEYATRSPTSLRGF